jgi:hypothetical protein
MLTCSGDGAQADGNLLYLSHAVAACHAQHMTAAVAAAYTVPYTVIDPGRPRYAPVQDAMLLKQKHAPHGTSTAQ